MANQTFLDGGVNARVVCRVWDGVDVGGEKNSDTWMWFFNDRLLFKQEAGQGPFIDDQVTCHGKKQKTSILLHAASFGSWSRRVQPNNIYRKLLLRIKPCLFQTKHHPAPRNNTLSKPTRKFILDPLSHCAAITMKNGK